MSRSDGRRVARATGARVLVADDHEATRALYRAALTQVDAVDTVLDAVDGAVAVAAAQATPLDVAILDLNMPRLDGVAAAACITALQPEAAIALHSSNPAALTQRGQELDVPLFDKADLGRLVGWVAAHAERLLEAQTRAAAAITDRSCATCGYGIACAKAPDRCPMCGRGARWTRSSKARACAAR